MSRPAGCSTPSSDIAPLGGAKDLPARAQELAAAAAAKKAELATKWADMSGGVPKMVEAIQSRVDILSQSKKLPAGLDKAKLEGAKAGLTALNQTWTEASEAYKAGNLTDAIGKATAAKDKAAEVMTALNMQLPAAAK
jgi:tetrahydromethanopterin S-methyltransferase subunit F